MTLEDIGAVFGDEVEVNFETAMNLEQENDHHEKGPAEIQQCENIKDSAPRA